MRDKTMLALRHSVSKGCALLILLLALSATRLQAQIQLTSPSSLRLMAGAPVNQVIFKFTVLPPNGKTISQVYTTLNGINYTASAPSGSVYTISWTSAAFGTYSLKGYVRYSNGSMDSTTDLVYKVIQTNVCGAMLYNNSTGYMQGDTVVTATDSVYRRNSWWMQGDYP